MLKSVEDINAFMEEVFTCIENGDFQKAFSLVKTNTVIESTQIDMLYAQTESQLNMLNKKYGRDNGFEQVGEMKLGNSLLKKVYIQKYNYIPLRWIFIFYNPGNGWKLIQFSFDEDYKELFKE